MAQALAVRQEGRRTLGLFLQILVFLIVAAALGFAAGWLLRGTRVHGESRRLADDWQARLAKVESERDRLQAELAAARDDRAALEQAQAEVRQSTPAGDAEKARATRLERELDQVREEDARHRAEIERLEARIAELQAGAAKSAPTTSGMQPAPAQAEGSAPPALPGPQGEPDDLKRISGIGPGIEKTLHEVGIFHFHQIAALTPENVAWLNQRLRFAGRIEREDWIRQAQKLAEGG